MIDLTPPQRKTVAAGITAFAATMVIAFVAAVGYGVLKFVDLVSSALVPVVMGIFLAMFFKPLYAWFRMRLHNPTLSVVAMSLSVLIPMAVIAWLCGAFIADQISAFIRTAPTILTRVSAWVNTQFPNAKATCSSLGLSDSQMLFFSDPKAFTTEMLAQISGQYGMSAMKASVGVLRHLSVVGTGLVTLIFFVFFLTRKPMNGSDYMRLAPFFKEETRTFIARQIDAFTDILVNFFQRQVVICLVEGILYGLGFVMVGLPYGFVLGFMLGAMNLVPLFGTICILPLALPIAFFGDGGSLLRLIGVTCVWLTGQVLDGYLITPMIQGNKTGLGFAGVIFSFIFWGTVFQSLLGLLLAIPLSAFCVVLWRAVKERYFKEGIV